MGILDFFKKEQKKSGSLDLTWMGTDMHSHLIPGIDDGAKTLDQSLALIKRMQGYGLKKIITTPHIMVEFYKNTPEIILSGLEKLQKALISDGMHISVKAAAEYNIDEAFLEMVRNGEELLTIHDNLILVETSFINKPSILLDTLFELELRGFQPVLAHPERYYYLMSDKSLQEDLLDRNVYFQANLLSFTGFYSKDVQRFAERLVDEKRIKLVGTDCHNMRYLDNMEQLTSSKYYEKLQGLNLLNHTL
ncbi:Tyrosine-protein phosphatase YwqE [Belliella buryatensis]|uniref:protein-tyrosine-phosphatase n=1 Tax=Belliella buryatensis TaxID=1500549 RepID=A0A239EAL0_9BACT|nr:CpsB/CapC family capsule biosynthesis tyrosine phosphatase [Belliella buryatensis]SNS41529.1 Tyrosine-protein phosphatase YwqE [Belliella buryatensis]